MLKAHDLGYQQLCNPIKIPWRWHRHLRRWFQKKIIGIGNIKIGLSPLIENVVLIDGLKHNLLSISQLCDRDFKVIFDDLSSNILDRQFNAFMLFDFHDNNVYMIDMSHLHCNVSV